MGIAQVSLKFEFMFLVSPIQGCTEKMNDPFNGTDFGRLSSPFWRVYIDVYVFFCFEPVCSNVNRAIFIPNLAVCDLNF